MTSRNPQYAKVRAAFAEGRKMGAAEVSRLTGRDREAALILLYNLRQRREIEHAGKVNGQTVFVIAATPPEPPRMQQQRAAEQWQRLLRVFRIGPAPARPLGEPRVVEMERKRP